jgi:rod shape-determining protein MreC
LLEFFKTHKFKIIIGIVALLFGMMLYSASADGAENIPRNLLSMVTTPFQKFTSFLSEKTGDVVDVFFHAKDNAEENKQLKEQIAELQEKLIDYETVKEENERLKAISDIKEVNPDYEMAPASVISRDPNDRYGSFIIDRGSLHGIELNDPVFTKSGLVGIVTSLGPTSARVRTILSPGISVGVYDITTKELGVLSGDADLAQEGKAKLSIMESDTKIETGSVIVTAGTSGLYPAGIPVGVVEEVRTEPHGITKYAVILPTESAEEVLDVIVLTGFLGQGSESVKFDGE